MCWWQLLDVGDSLGRFGLQHQLSFSNGVGHQHSKNVTNIEILSPTLSHQHHDVTNIAITGEFQAYFSKNHLNISGEHWNLQWIRYSGSDPNNIWTPYVEHLSCTSNETICDWFIYRGGIGECS